MIEFDKIKIDLLRDSLKDTSETVRSLDRKLIFLVSYNALFFGLISTILIKNPNGILNDVVFNSILVAFAILWTILLIWLMMNIHPVKNPLSALNKEDKNFFDDIYSVSVVDNQQFSIEDLSNNYNQKIKDTNDIIKLLYTEIVKTSTVGDARNKMIKISTILSYIISVCFAYSFIFYQFLL